MELRALKLRIAGLYAKTKRFPKLSENLQRHHVNFFLSSCRSGVMNAYVCSAVVYVGHSRSSQLLVEVTLDMRTARLYTLQTPRSTKHACCKRSPLLSASGIDP